MNKPKIAYLITAILLITGLVSCQFLRWRDEMRGELTSGGTIIQTRKGEMEYSTTGSGPAVIVLHGLNGGYDQGMVTVRLLNDDGFQWISVSRPGYLGTPLSTGETLQEQANALAGLLDTLQIQKAAVIAQSIGGPYALQFALQNPDRCWALVLISAVAIPKVAEEPSLLERSLSLLVESDVGNWVMLSMLESWPKQMTRLLITNPRQLETVMNDPVKLRSILDSANSLAPISSRKAGSKNDIYQITNMRELPVQEINTPTMVISGAKNDMVEDANYLAGRVPDLELILVEQGEHSTFIVFSDDLAPKVLDFLHKHIP
jgi:pimeloyl-ACP methyl ester carboxylesterase